MGENSQDEFTRALGKLESILGRIEQINNGMIEEFYVYEFHTALDKLTGVGIDVSEYRIPDSEINTISDASFHPYTPGDPAPFPRSKEKYMKRQHLLVRLSEVIVYLKRLASEKPKDIGLNIDRD